jgi:NAD(P)-dependent dehydrogenase (short-subunit alcohol dehydrogenase family)
MEANARTALVTGGNRGLGKETCRQLAGRGFRVLLASRQPQEGRAAAAELDDAGRVEPLVLDVADPHSIDAAVARLRDSKTAVDVLVNNAGIALEGFDADIARDTIEVNFFGPLRVTEALLPLIPPGGNVVMVSSGMGELSGLDASLRARFTDPALTRDALVELMRSFVTDVAAGQHRARGWPSSAYRVSKVGLNALVRVLAPALADRRIIVNAVCPGWVRTDMGGPGASRSIPQGAASVVWAATREGADAPTGGFFRDGRPIDW